MATGASVIHTNNQAEVTIREDGHIEGLLARSPAVEALGKQDPCAFLCRTRHLQRRGKDRSTESVGCASFSGGQYGAEA